MLRSVLLRFIVVCVVGFCSALSFGEVSDSIIYTDGMAFLIHRRYAEGAKPTTALIWRDNNIEEIVESFFEPKFWFCNALASIRIGDDIAIVWSNFGYCRYSKELSWKKLIETPLGGRLNLEAKKVLFLELGEIEIIRHNNSRFQFTITDTQLIPGLDTLFRVVLKDGVPYKPPGTDIGGAVWDANRKGEKNVGIQKMTMPEIANHGGKELVRPATDIPAYIENETQTTELPAFWAIVSCAIVILMLVTLVLRMRKRA